MVLNKRGHTKTLVAAHPGNRNALKAGVFSPATHAERIDEVAAEISRRAPIEVELDILGRELAALVVLADLMDQSLSDQGVLGRQGEPRRMVELRMRLSPRITRTLEQRREAHAAAEAAEREKRTAGHDSAISTHADQPDPISLAVMVAQHHFRSSLTELALEELDPEVFWNAVLRTEDPTVTPSERRRAARRLSRAKKTRADYCACRTTLKARDAIEFREWLDTERPVEQSESDVYLASLVRRIAAGETLSPPIVYTETVKAVHDVVNQEVARARRAVEDTGVGPDPAAAVLWRRIISEGDAVAPRDLLETVAALEDMDAFQSCICVSDGASDIDEIIRDRTRAHVIRLVSLTNWYAAQVIPYFHETYVAVQEAADRAILREVEHASSHPVDDVRSPNA